MLQNPKGDAPKSVKKRKKKKREKKCISFCNSLACLERQSFNFPQPDFWPTWTRFPHFIIKIYLCWSLKMTQAGPSFTKYNTPFMPFLATHFLFHEF